MKTPFVSRGLLAVAFFAAWGVATGANAACLPRLPVVHR